MTKKFNISGILFLLVLIATTCGIGYTWDIIKSLVIGMWEFVLCLPQLIKPFIPFLGIEDMAVSMFIFGFVLVIASAFGIFISRKQKSNLWFIISGAIGIVSTLITIGLAIKM